MAEKNVFSLPQSLKDLFNKPNFTIEEIISLMELEENKKFLKEIEPLIKSILSEKFPMLSMFL